MARCIKPARGNMPAEGNRAVGFVTDRRSLIRSLAGMAAIATVPGLTACAVYRSHGQMRYTTTPHQPVYYYDYYYYPDVAIYYHVHTGYYFHFYNGSWRRTRQRPQYVRLDDRGRRSVVIREEVPYARHQEHRRQFGNPGNARWGSGQGPGPDRNYKDRIGRRGDGYEWQREGNPQAQGGGQVQTPNGGGQVRGKGQPQPQPQSQTQSQPQPQPQPQLKPRPQPKQQSRSRPKPQSRPQPQSRPKSKAEPGCPSGSGKGKGAGCR